MDIGFSKDIAIIIGGVVALFTFINGVLEYMRQGAQRRVQQFVVIRQRFKENPVFKELSALISTDDERLLNVPAQDKKDYLGLLEEVALMMNSGLIRKDVAHYMFGGYAIKCWESKNFWNNVEREDIYWSLFRIFARDMKKYEENFHIRKRKLRF